MLLLFVKLYIGNKIYAHKFVSLINGPEYTKIKRHINTNCRYTYQISSKSVR